jgi:hypothetical protein
MPTQRSLAAARLVLAALIGSGAAAAHAKTASAEESRQQMNAIEGLAARAASEAGSPWWAAFNEPALMALQTAARAQVDDAQGATPVQVNAQVTAAYVAARILNVRLNLVREFSQSLATQTRLLNDAAPGPNQVDVLAAIEARRVEAEGFATNLQREREAAVAALAQWCRLSPDAAARLMEPAFAMHELPLFDAPTPTRLPRSVLRARADVKAAERRMLLQRKSTGAALPWQGGEAVRSGWIEIDAAQELAAARSSAPDAADLAEVVSRAEDEVRTQLRGLQQRSAEVAKLVEIVRTRRVELDAALRRIQLGAGSTDEAAEDYRRLLIENDRLAVAGGELAYSWIALQLSTAGLALQPAVAEAMKR